MRTNSKSLIGMMGFTALFAAGLLVSAVPAQADPPGHAKAYGWRNKQKKAKKHNHSRSCDHDNYNSRYDDRYDDDYRWRQQQDRRRWEEEQRRRRYEEDQRRRYENDRYYDRNGRTSTGGLEDLAGVFLGGGRGADLGGLGGLLGGGRGGDLGGLLGGLRIRK